MEVLVCQQNCKQSVKKILIFLQTGITSKSPLSPTKPSDSYKAVDYSSTAPTEVVSNNANSSGGGSSEPNETQQQDNNDHDGKTSKHTQSDYEEHYGQLKEIKYFHCQQFEIFPATP